ncbi:GNAT family protein [Saccharothrix mutabilis subsp. mutabilis]|uniref:GNAT family protein n=1 Tax=Saccharothrix mutabilis subsp. mutabilis TaxID=66855 RepID=A0ABN0TKG4_9PSEU
MAHFERTTARLTLRRVRMSDLAAFIALENALRAPEGRTADEAASARYLSRFTAVWDRGELGYWAVETAGRVVGFGGVQPHGDAWNLYYRVDPAFHGLGIATEVAREAVAAAGEVRPDRVVRCETRPGNAAAIRVAERAGLTRVEDRDGYAVLELHPDER